MKKNKDNPEYRSRKQFYGGRRYYRKVKFRFWKIFLAWKKLSVKNLLSTKIKQIPRFITKENTTLLKTNMEAWKIYCSVNAKPNNKVIVCFF